MHALQLFRGNLFFLQKKLVFSSEESKTVRLELFSISFLKWNLKFLLSEKWSIKRAASISTSSVNRWSPGSSYYQREHPDHPELL